MATVTCIAGLPDGRVCVQENCDGVHHFFARRKEEEVADVIEDH